MSWEGPMPWERPMPPSCMRTSSLHELKREPIARWLVVILPPRLTAQSGNPSRKGLPKRTPSLSKQLDQWVQESGGDLPIHSVLVANNGLAAVKFMRSIRSWAAQTLGSSKAISLVAMATPNDLRINAEHVQLSDQFVEVPGGSNNNNYANVSLILQVAVRAGVDAVWPGW
jgi:acetyl-CoA carboxylase/biotin carboxylase 1